MSASSAACSPASRSDSPADPTADQRVVGIDVAAPVVVEKTSKRSIGIMTSTYAEKTMVPNSRLGSVPTFSEQVLDRPGGELPLGEEPDSRAGCNEFREVLLAM